MSHAVTESRDAAAAPVFPERAIPIGLMLLSAALRLWHLGSNGFGSEYYAAAVRGMSISLHNAFFNAFDPAGTLMVDKPPLAFWVQLASSSLFGFSAFSLMLPQAIEGCISVWLVWYLTRRDFGLLAGALAGLFMALTPVAVAVDRSNNTDSLLVAVLLAAAWAMPQRDQKRGEQDEAEATATERRQERRLILGMMTVGVGFNVKMMAAFGVLPAFAMSWLFTARTSWVRRCLALGAAGAVMAVVSLSWVGAVALTPPEDRPYVDSTRNNSILDLAINHNALQRFLPRGRNGAYPAPQYSVATVDRAGSRVVPAGVGRLFDLRLASQTIWFLPLALVGLVAMIRAGQWARFWLWGGWALSYWIVFSFAGGIFSAYYLVLLAPPLAVLAGTGAAWVIQRPDADIWSRVAMATVVFTLSLAWQAIILWPDAWDNERGELLLTACVLLLLAVLAMAYATSRNVPAPMMIATMLGGVAALLVAPCGYVAGSIAYASDRPVARLERAPERQNRIAREQDTVTALVPWLMENRGGARFLLATANARQAAPLIIRTGMPVLTLGGFQGSIPVEDESALTVLVKTGELRFALLPEGRGRRAYFGTADNDATRWVRAHGKRVDLAGIVPDLADAPFALYDLRFREAAAPPDDNGPE